MSRTYRRFNKAGREELDSCLNGMWSHWLRQDETEEERYTFAVKYHSDGYRWSGSPSTARGLREETRTMCRANQREQLHRITKVTDYEDAYYDSSHEDAQAGYLVWVYY